MTCRAAILLALLACAASCAAPPKSSTLTTDDLVETTAQMAAQLADSDFLRGRAPDSPPIVIAISRVQNLSSDIIPQPQQWWMVARVRDQLNINTLRATRNIRFVIPKQFLLEGMERGHDGLGADRLPTHEMSATFRSATRAARKDRTDAYLCEYRITEIGSGTLAWTGEFTFKRTAFGRAYD